MSWVEVGSNPREISRLEVISNRLWNFTYTDPAKSSPFHRPWMYVNFCRHCCGCYKCAKFLNADTSQYGTKIGKSGAIGKKEKLKISLE